jgi:hypothetical protein
MYFHMSVSWIGWRADQNAICHQTILILGLTLFEVNAYKEKIMLRIARYPIQLARRTFSSDKVPVMVEIQELTAD